MKPRFTKAQLVLGFLALFVPLGVLQGIVTWNTRIYVCGSTPTEGHIEQYRTYLQMYAGANGGYPTTEQGLAALTSKPTLEPIPKNWRMLLDAPIRDPWGHEYFYEMPGTHNPQGFDVFSAGEDGKPHTKDDLGNW